MGYMQGRLQRDGSFAWALQYSLMPALVDSGTMEICMSRCLRTDARLSVLVPCLATQLEPSANLHISKTGIPRIHEVVPKRPLQSSAEPIAPNPKTIPISPQLPCFPYPSQNFSKAPEAGDGEIEIEIATVGETRLFEGLGLRVQGFRVWVLGFLT